MLPAQQTYDVDDQLAKDDPAPIALRCERIGGGLNIGGGLVETEHEDQASRGLPSPALH